MAESFSEVRSVVYRDETVFLDDHMFHQCAFHHCDIRYSGGFFFVEDTTFTECSFAFSGSAQRTVEFLAHFGFMPPAPAKLN